MTASCSRAWIVVLAGLLALFTLAFADSLPTQADVLRETRLMAGNAGFRMLSLSPGASIGAYTMSRGVGHARRCSPP